jgi:hypothetical protein
VNGNQGGAVKTQNGDVYAGHDGNAYQHSSDGWSKWGNGGWQPVNPPTNNSSRGQTNQPATQSQQMQRTANAGSVTAGQGTSRTGMSSAQAQRESFGRSSYPSMESSSYQQLEQDRQARASGSQGFGGGRFSGGSGGLGGGQSRFGGGSFQGFGGGGGHFRR